MVPTVIRKRNRPFWDGAFGVFPDFFDRPVEHGEEGDGPSSAYGLYPVDIHEDDHGVYVEAELPGFTKDQVNVTLEGGVLSITAQRDQTPEREGTTHLAQRRFRQVNRRFSMPDSVDQQKVEAKLEDGVLHLKLGKRADVLPRKIEVK